MDGGAESGLRPRPGLQQSVGVISWDGKAGRGGRQGGEGVAGFLLASDLHGESRREAAGLAELRRGTQDGASAAGSLHGRAGWGHPGRVCRWTEKREAARDHTPGPQKLGVGGGGAGRGTEVREEVGALYASMSPRIHTESTWAPHPHGA